VERAGVNGGQSRAEAERYRTEGRWRDRTFLDDLAAVRSAIAAAFAPYLKERGAARWCDKSLDTVMWVDLVGPDL
jgi:hypothetical protein